ncbi:MAG: hypothetical protein ACRCYQ_11680 [Nocardioides sp.]
MEAHIQACPRCRADRGGTRYCANCGYDFSDAGHEAASTETGPMGPEEYDAALAAIANRTGSEPAAGSDPDQTTAEQIASLVRVGPPQPPRTGTAMNLSEDEPDPGAGAGPGKGGVAAPGAYEEQRRSSYAPLILVALTALVVVGALFGLRYLDRESSSATDAGQEADPVESTDSPEPSPAPESPSDSAEATPSAVPVEQVRCWNGRTAADLADCDSPAGLAGLRWVFPSLEPDSCERLREPGRPQFWRCDLRVDSGEEALAYYSEWESSDAARIHFTQSYGPITDRSEERLRWDDPQPDGEESSVTVVYTDTAMAVHIEAESRADLREAESLVEMRDTEKVRGVAETP